eukprot:Blabericola_migrator_1__1919@NODE_1522_length_4352_cov_15_201867_g1002_i0_p1_GENE_NODE_1522_length_4352_cov_15_201867_g1002_i0NODE_1522_length_4352_cov_15_201867_g1002_i0_p1_ORF_typecomplete_len458_score57_07AP2/PF00847_20/1_1e08_NODE_1522_length_4352_cov_15_201867_g1002_i029634336
MNVADQTQLEERSSQKASTMTSSPVVETSTELQSEPLPCKVPLWWENPHGNEAEGVAESNPLPNMDLSPPAGVAMEEPGGLDAISQVADGSEEDNSIDELLTQLLKISRKSPNATQDASYESIKNMLSGVEGAELQQSVTLDPALAGADGMVAPCASYDHLVNCSDGMAGGSMAFGGLGDPSSATNLDFWVSQNAQFALENIKAEDGELPINPNSNLTPEEEAAICALVPKLVRVSISKPVRGVYLDRRRGLWRANWREGGKVKTKGFRIAQWGEQEARRKAIEVRKLMETRGCFLKLKAVAMGDPSRETDEKGQFSRMAGRAASELMPFESNSLDSLRSPQPGEQYNNFYKCWQFPPEVWDPTSYQQAMFYNMKNHSLSDTETSIYPPNSMLAAVTGEFVEPDPGPPRPTKGKKGRGKSISPKINKRAKKVTPPDMPRPTRVLPQRKTRSRWIETL